MFADDPGVRIPAVYAGHTTRRVLTLEDVYFIKITDYAAVEAAGVSRAEAADRLFSTYLRQIFLEGFFHADPHPGNLFIEPLDGRWRLVFVDFGMVGRLSAGAKQGLRDLAIAVGARDLDRLMRAYQELDILLPGADLARIRQAEAAVFDRFWGKSMRELAHTHPQEMRRFAREFRDLMNEMPFQAPRDLIFLGRCVAILSGMCSGLNPEFNLFGGLAPFADSSGPGGRRWLGRLLGWLVEEGGRSSRFGTPDLRVAGLEGRTRRDRPRRARLERRRIRRTIGRWLVALSRLCRVALAEPCCASTARRQGGRLVLAVALAGIVLSAR
jgi:hypothetical protein